MSKTSTIAVRARRKVKEAPEKAGLLENIKPSERGLAEKSVREGRESHWLLPNDSFDFLYYPQNLAFSSGSFVFTVSQTRSRFTLKY